MTSYFDRHASKRFEISQVLVPLTFLLLLSPAVYHLERWVAKTAMDFFKKPNSTELKLSTDSLQLLRNPRVHMIRVSVPGSILRYQRVMASRSSLPSYFDGNVKMMAVSRNAKDILEQHAMNYVDPITLPTALKASLQLPIPGYLLIKDF